MQKIIVNNWKEHIRILNNRERSKKVYELWLESKTRNSNSVLYKLIKKNVKN